MVPFMMELRFTKEHISFASPQSQNRLNAFFPDDWDPSYDDL
jgi:hypothetical protein